jgi:hypothetical protein
MAMAHKEEGPGLPDRLRQTERALTAALIGFDEADDSSLTEYYLYAVSALRAKHTYLLRQLRPPQEKEARP